ncbi:MAG TPA: TonB-dependent receptor [Micropepsaceae bacterium]|nr:TonB-dependent receptor [Micropepsaceae bacterium]
MAARSMARARARHCKAVAFCAAGALVISPAGAQTGAAPESVLVTARPPDPVGNGAFSTIIIDAEQLRITPQLDEVLRQVPSVSLFRSYSSASAYPARVGVSLRSLIAGSGVGRALVTLDGVPQNDPFGQWVVPASLPVEGIQSVEIVRGAGAGPYGAGALTGVIELSESDLPGMRIDAEAGNLDQQRYAFAGNAQTAGVSLGATASYQKSGGWFPVDKSQRGAADTPVSVEARSLSARAATEIFEGTLLAVRFAGYDERRGAGIVNNGSDAKGISGSATIAHRDSIDEPEWRWQIWFRASDFTATPSSIGSDRNSTTPFSDVYGTPALGWGANAAVRGAFNWLGWELGADARFTEGEARELFSYRDGAFQANRFSGGRGFVGGIYAEAAAHLDNLLITVGARVDQWRDSGGHVLERALADGSIILDDEFGARSGTIPTLRGGIREEVTDALYVRAAGYEGFRQPSLNELYRLTRSGNTVMEANPALEPERLYGAEIGMGGNAGAVTWDVTGFWNRLSGAISSVTVAIGPRIFPDAGFLPPGGQLIQRQNVGYVQAFGLEGEARWRLADVISLRAAYAVTDARVNGGDTLPWLTGKRPAQTSRLSVSPGFVAFPFPAIAVEADATYQSKRFADDQNTLVLPGATTFNAKISWRFAPQAEIYFAADNIANSRVAVMEGGDHVTMYDQPRALRAGLRLTLSP